MNEINWRGEPYGKEESKEEEISFAKNSFNPPFGRLEFFYLFIGFQ